jgi:molybdate transport system ATP-binding protein
MTLDVALRHAFPGFDLDVQFAAPGGVTALFGRSGSGKTTIVNAVAGLMRPTQGRVTLDGRVLADTASGTWVPAHRRRFGYVFQEGRLFPHLSMRQNLTYGRWFAGRSKGDSFDGVVDLLGLQPLLSRRIAALSGGEKQRVALGRALLAEPSYLLMDEPLAALDEVRKAEILPYLERIRDHSGIPILYISHSLAEVARLATTIVVIDAGRVRRTGPASELLADPETAPIFGVGHAGAILTGHVVAHHEDGLSEIAISGGRLLLPHVAAGIGQTLRLRVAAQDVILSRAAPVGLSALNILEGEVTALHQGEGPGVIVQLRIGQEMLLARITGRSANALGLERGQKCHAIIKSLSVHRADVGFGPDDPSAGR